MPEYSRNYPQTFTPDGTDIETAFDNDDKELQRVYSILSNMGALQLFGAKRQSVLYGSTDANGNPNYLSANGLQVSIDGASKPIYLAFANGFSDSGTVDLLDKISSLVSNAWTLPANQTCYLYVDKDVNTGLLSYGFSLLPDLYQDKAPDSPTLDQHWYNTTETKMYRWNGSAWENKQRVFIAKAVTDASTTTLTLYGFVSQAPLKAKSIIVNGNNISYNIWQVKKTYAIGDICYSPNALSYVRMECIVPGISGTVEPIWPVVGQTVTDGTTKWIVDDIRDGAIPGDICPPSMIVRPGRIKCMGQVVKRSDFPRLWNFANTNNLATTEANWSGGLWGLFSVGDGSTTFRIPDLRGVFFRNYDDGKGLDPSSAIGKYENDMLQGHKHSSSYYVWSSYYNGNDRGSVGGNGQSDLATIMSPTLVSDGTNGTPRTGPETRGKNISYYATMKY